MKLKIVYVVIAVIALVFGIFFISARNSSKGQIINGIPQQPIHWHPALKIITNGEGQVISANIGMSIGNNIDNQISGMRMSPTHTHERDGTIHLESNRPWQKPETLTLGYFFKVWGKNFTNNCIFEHCNNENKKLTMTVNGEPNNEFDKYMMKDNDKIVIEYK